MPRKKHNSEPLPLRYVKEFEKKYPGVWKGCDMAYMSNGIDGNPAWNPICLVPFRYSLTLAEFYADEYDMSAAEYAQFALICSGLYAWRKYKGIYTFDEALAVTLMEQVEDIKLPIEVLSRLPVPAVWIQFQGQDYGYFVWFDYIFVDGGEDFLTLRIFGIDEENKVSLFSISLIEGLTISEGIAHSRQFFNKDSLKDEAFANGIVSVILYLCAENKDMEENPVQKQITARTATSVTAPKDVFREIRKWDVGYRIGKKISAARQSNPQHSGHLPQGGSGATGTPKRPHVRRGHYHSYWVGSHSSGDRKLVLKWVAPTFINGGEDDMTATVHEVK